MHDGGDSDGAGTPRGEAGGQAHDAPPPPRYPTSSYPPPPPPQPPFAAPSVSFPPPGSFTAPPGQPYAGWGTRVGGWIIDAVILGVAQLLLNVLCKPVHALDVHADFTVHRSNGTIDHRHITISVLALLLTVVVVLTYTTLLIGGPRGQTVGMMAVGVRAVDRDGLGPVPSPRALGRSVFEQVLRAPAFVGLAAPGLLLLLVVWILDMLFPLWDAQHQTLHDKVADTVVLRVRSMG